MQSASDAAENEHQWLKCLMTRVYSSMDFPHILKPLEIESDFKISPTHNKQSWWSKAMFNGTALSRHSKERNTWSIFVAFLYPEAKSKSYTYLPSPKRVFFGSVA